jgi:hypothetical protein
VIAGRRQCSKRKTPRVLTPRGAAQPFGARFGVRVQLPPLKSIIHRCFPKANIYARVQNGVVAGTGCINILCNKPFALAAIIVYGLAGSFNLLI